MTQYRPMITTTTHVLPFQRLSWEDFERVSLALLLREGFSQVQRFGATGSEQGRDITALRNGQLWYIQCKRVKEIKPQMLLAEIEKIHEFGQTEPRLYPEGLLFMVASEVSAQARDRAGEYCATLGVQCEIWGESDLDVRVKQYPDIVRNFFGQQAEAAASLHLLDLPSEDEAGPVDQATPDEERLLYRYAFEAPQDLERGIEHVQRLLQVQRKQWAKAQVAGLHGGSGGGVDAAEEALYLEDEMETEKARLAELQRAYQVARRLKMPSQMLIKDFLEGNVYRYTLELLTQALSIVGGFDALALVQRMGEEMPAYRRRMALRLLHAADVDDHALALALHPVIDGIAGQPGSGYIRVPDGKYRRVRF